MSGGLHEARKKALEKATIPKALLDKYDVEVTDTAFVISEKNTRPQIDKRKVQIHYEDRFLYVNATSYSDYNHKDTPGINIRACKVTKEQVEFLHNVPQIDAEAIEDILNDTIRFGADLTRGIENLTPHSFVVRKRQAILTLLNGKDT